MAIIPASAPFRVLISAGAEGPRGPGIASAALSASGQLLIGRDDGVVLPPFDLASTLSAPAAGTLDGELLGTIGGDPIGSID